jgi:hypothetical protein
LYSTQDSALGEFNFELILFQGTGVGEPACNSRAQFIGVAYIDADECLLRGRKPPGFMRHPAHSKPG